MASYVLEGGIDGRARVGGEYVKLIEEIPGDGLGQRRLNTLGRQQHLFLGDLSCAYSVAIKYSLHAHTIVRKIHLCS